jgi:hypothetical protein
LLVESHFHCSTGFLSGLRNPSVSWDSVRQHE